MSKRGIVMLAVCAGLVAPTLAQEPAPDGWQIAADLGLNFNQSAYSNSWTGGEASQINWTLLANLLAEKQLRPTLHWRNTLKLSYGQTHREDTGEDGKRYWLSPEKSSDRIFLESLMRFTRGWLVDPFAALTFESQFHDASIPEVSRFINPIRLTEAVGVGRTFHKSENTELLTRLGFALRQHIHKDVLTIDPEETETNTETDGGAEWVTDFAHTFAQHDIQYVSKLRVFQAFFNSASDDLEGLPNADYWKTADVAWENTFSAAISKYIQVSLFFELLYDKEIDLRGRFREILALGVSYKLF